VSERLTKVMNDPSYGGCGGVILAKCENCTTRLSSCYEDDCGKQVEANQKLAVIENMLYDADGNEVISLSRLRELAEAEREGKIKIGSDWTPCAEGMPETRETVLVTVEDGYGNDISFDIMFAWRDEHEWKDGYANNIPVIAWQPLPAPYNPERKEDADKNMEKEKNMNKFYEFKEPYYAMIAAPTKERAVELYHEDICDHPEEGEEESAPVEITEEAARTAWEARGNKDEDPEDDFDGYLTVENGCSMLIDGSLY